VAELARGEVITFTVTPADFGIAAVPLEALRGGDARDNAEIIRRVLGKERGPARNAVVLNAAAALRVAGLESDLRSAAQRAAAAIDSGAAERTLDRWARLTQQP
jgi:anthranilate phosphoribosyltransferase